VRMRSTGRNFARECRTGSLQSVASVRRAIRTCVVFARTTPEGTSLPWRATHLHQQGRPINAMQPLGTIFARISAYAAVQRATATLLWRHSSSLNDSSRSRPVPSAKDRSLLDPLCAVRPFNRVVGPNQAFGIIRRPDTHRNVARQFALGELV